MMSDQSVGKRASGDVAAVAVRAVLVWQGDFEASILCSPRVCKGEARHRGLKRCRLFVGSGSNNGNGVRG